jgi:hypothetical protein
MRSPFGTEERDRHTTGLAAGAGVSSLPSNRLDIAVLCHMGPPVEPGPPPALSAGAKVSPTYLLALPLPGLAEGRRFTITEVDRGITCASSLYSEDARVRPIAHGEMKLKYNCIPSSDWEYM